MANLKHSVYDSDTHFTINPVTRVLQNVGSSKNRLIQYDHNSERFTFEIPRYIEGHDMSTCNVIRVNYNNIDTQTKQQNMGVYEVDDMQVSPDDENVVILSWLISSNATQYVGSLNFLIRFCCADDDGVVCYAWNTAIYSGISVSSGIDNGELIVEEYPDILTQWKAELDNAVDEMVTSENVMNALLQAVDEGRVDSFITTIKTIDGRPLKIFVGTQAEYNDLTTEQKQNLFAIISDDTTKDTLFNTINGIMDGSMSVGLALNAEKAQNMTMQSLPIQEDGTVEAREKGIYFLRLFHKNFNCEFSRVICLMDDRVKSLDASPMTYSSVTYLTSGYHARYENGIISPESFISITSCWFVKGVL